MRVQRVWMIRLEIESMGIQCNSIGPFQTGPSSASDQLGTGNWINLQPPLSKHYLYFYQVHIQLQVHYHSYVLILSKEVVVVASHLFCCRGLLPARVIPRNHGSSIILTNQTSKLLNPLSTGSKQFSHCPPPVLPDSLIRYTQTKLHASSIAPSNKGYQPVSRSDASQTSG